MIEDIVLGCRAGDAGRTSKGHIIKKKMRPFEFMLLPDSAPVYVVFNTVDINHSLEIIMGELSPLQWTLHVKQHPLVFCRCSYK